MEDSKVTLRISRHDQESAVRLEDQKSVQSSINYLDNNCDEAKILDDELESARSEMGEVREENERLKMKLKLIEKDYQSLKRRFLDVFQQEHNKKSKDSSFSSPRTHEEKEEHDLVFLSLGRSSPSEPKNNNKDEKMITAKAKEDHHQRLKEALGLELKYQMLSSSKQPEVMDVRSIGSGETSFEEAKEEEAAAGGETWPPSKVLKPTIKEGLDNNNEVSQQNQVKRARVSVRARCDAPTMNDGCQWRKYGQKISKGNPCPRAYYRCTVAPACPVRKQVQRCAEDMSILITTYEGTHSHPLPMSATAMASTTSAAASMLLSGSSTSTQGGPGASSAATGHHYLHGLMNFNQFDSSRQRQFYMSNSSTAPAFPTITLDLTTTSPLSSSSSSSNLFNRLSSTTRLPSTSLSFSSSESNILPTLWNNNNGHLNHGTFPYNNTQLGSFDFGSQFQGHAHQDPPQQLLTETLTKAITSDPSFRTVIAAAISSMAGGAGKNQGGGESFGQNLKWCEQIPAASLNALTHNSKGCASSYLDRTSSSNSQRGSLTLLQPPFPFSISKGTSAAPAATDDRDELS